MIMLLEQDQMGQYCRLHLTIAFGLLEPLLHQSILFLAHHSSIANRKGRFHVLGKGNNATMVDQPGTAPGS